MALYNITTKQEFEDKVLKSKKVVLVDFWAQWCPPCRAMAPILHALSEKLDDNFDVVKIDVEQTPDNGSLAQQYGVQGIPNMQIFRSGKVVKEIVGMRPQQLLESELVEIIKAA